MSLTAGIHNIPLADYLADPAPAPSLSSSIAHRLVTQAPCHAWARHPRLNPAYQSEDGGKMDVGSAVHAILLEGAENRVAYIDAEDWRTKVAKEERDAARVAGRIPLLVGNRAIVNAMVSAGRDALAKSELDDAWTHGEAEATLLWQESDIWCRCRPDWLSFDKRTIISVKTTAGSAEPNTFLRNAIIPHGYDLQAAMEARGVMQIFKPTACRVVWVVIECEPPHAVSLVGLTPEFLEHAERKLRWAMVKWATCLKADSWPGYDSRIAWLDLPAWAQAQFTERLFTEEAT